VKVFTVIMSFLTNEYQKVMHALDRLTVSGVL